MDLKVSKKAFVRLARCGGCALGVLLAFLSILPVHAVEGWATIRVRENLNRGIKAIYTGSAVHVSWRLLETDDRGIGFHVERAAAATGPWNRLTTSSPIYQTTDYVDVNEPANTTVFYRVIPVIAGRSSSPSEASSVSTTEAKNYTSIYVGSSVGKVGIGDLDGDGTYDFVVRTPQGSIDPYYWNASTSTYKLLAFKSDGTLLWTHDLGPNIEMGIWYSPFVVFDFDGDGKAEVAVKTAPMTPDYSVSNGTGVKVTQGPEFLSILNGQTGAIVSSLPWPDRSELGTYNEYSRNQIGVAFLDGRTPCIIAARGTYGVMKASAFQYTGGALSQLWAWKSSDEADPEYFKTGAHSMRCVDVDRDGRDEVILGSSIVDDDGTGMWNNKLGHCDHLYVGDIDPNRSGLEMYYGYEDNYNNTQYPYHYGKGISLWDAETGEVIWQLNQPTEHIHDEGLVADLDPAYPGMELYSGELSTQTTPNPALLYFHSAAGQSISHKGLFFDSKLTYRAAYWDADLQREAIVRQTLYNFPTNEVVHVAPVKEFNKTAGTGWTYTPPPSGTGSAQTTSDGFKVDSSAGGWIYRSDTPIPVTAGQTYRITADLQNSPIVGHIQLGLTTLNSSGAIVQDNVIAPVPEVTELTVLPASPQPPGLRTELMATYTVPSGVTHIRPMFTGNRSGKFLLFNLMVLRDTNPGRGLDVVQGYAAAYGDISGDWREEIITSYGKELRIYSTSIPAADRRVTLMQDPIYRLDVAHLAMGYDQVPTTSYCLSQPVEQNLMTIAPEADATVRGGGSATVNYGSSQDLSTTTGSPDQSYLRFDLASVPPGKGISKATLRLRVKTQSGSPTNSLFFVANDGWTEGSLNWNNKPALTTPALGSKTVPTAGEWLEFDVTARAQAELNGDSWLSVALASSSSASATFSSTEGNNPPHLIIELTDEQAAPQDIEMHLALDESSGTIAADSSSGGTHPGTLIGSPTWQPSSGKIGGALQFDGQNRYVQVADSNGLDTTNQFTISLWAYPTLLDGQARALISKRNQGVAAYSLFLYTGNRLYVDIDSASNDRFSSNTVFQTNQWYHIALVYDGNLAAGSRAKLYVNGVLDKTAAETSTTLPNTSSNLLLGILEANYSYRYSGRMDEAKIYRRALAPGEISSLASGEPPTLVTMDNADASGVDITGAWTPSTNTAGYLGSNYLQDGGGTKTLPAKTVRFTPDLVAGTYEVFARWPAAGTRTTVPFSVVHASGTQNIPVNQTMNSGTWVSLGTYAFNEGTGGSVLISNAGTPNNTFVIVDAVKFEPVP